MDLHLHDTMTRRKRRFEPADPNRITMYVCGPTVYNYAHIGNARPFVVFDVLFRLLRRAYGDDAVRYARNITDIDDRIIAKAQEAREPFTAITERYAAVFREDMAALNVLTPSFEPHATGAIDAMLDLIDLLVANGAAYRAASGVYFSVAADADYGRLSGRAQEDLRAGARVEGEDDKRDPSDFALWKTAKPGEPFWNSPYGQGRPGWHLECSAMIKSALGETIDIHAGGHDLIFPHHENEIAQSETANGAPLARYWLHNGFLTMASEKMSKSLGNIVTVHDLLAAGHRGETLRFALLSAHYRAPLDWTDQLLEQAKASLDRLYGALQRATAAERAEPPAAFLEALSDDLNTPRAVAELFTLATQINASDTAEEKARLAGALRAAGDLIGLLQAEPDAWFKGGADDAEIDALVAQRVAARKAKDFAEADRLRAALDARGVIVMDGPEGSAWRRA
ncbi:MAG: cysteine--tRNA ligase [Alphaproteobacteria bacterium]|nr:cysteine--tRNA ligase [Alphaproteobacteria bacterium]